MTVTIDLLRHGQVTGKAALYGQTNVTVTSDGLDAMRKQVSKLAIDGQIFSSPLRRCSDFANELNVTVTLVDELAEMDFGSWDGVPFDEFKHQWHELNNFWQYPNLHNPPGGEQLSQFYCRVISGWKQVVENSVEGQNLVICHGGVIRVILAYVLNIGIDNPLWFTSLNIDYASLTRINIPQHAEAIPSVKYINKEFSG